MLTITPRMSSRAIIYEVPPTSVILSAAKNIFELPREQLIDLSSQKIIQRLTFNVQH